MAKRKKTDGALFDGIIKNVKDQLNGNSGITITSPGEIEWGTIEPASVASEKKLKEENAKLRKEVLRIEKMLLDQIYINEGMRDCVLTLVSYLEAPMKARSKLTDIKKALK